MAKKEKYRLEVLLEMRQRAKDEAEQLLGKRMAELKEEQDRLKEMELELERMIQTRESKKKEYAEKAMRGELNATSVMSSNVYIERLKEQEYHQEEVIQKQHEVILQRKDAVEAARQELIKANQELKALEKHKEKWKEERKKAIMKKEEDIQDDIAQTIFYRKE